MKNIKILVVILAISCLYCKLEGQVMFSNGFTFVGRQEFIISVPKEYSGVIIVKNYYNDPIFVDFLKASDFKISTETGISNARAKLNNQRHGIIILENGHFALFFNPENKELLKNIHNPPDALLQDLLELPITKETIHFLKNSEYDNIYKFFGIFNIVVNEFEMKSIVSEQQFLKNYQLVLNSIK